MQVGLVRIPCLRNLEAVGSLLCADAQSKNFILGKTSSSTYPPGDGKLGIYRLILQ